MFKFISHRGNICGKNICNENKLDCVEHILNNTYYDVEIDVLNIDNDVITYGHDTSNSFKGPLSFIKQYQHKLWIHCKSVDTYLQLKKYTFNIFFHQNDDITTTTQQYVLVNPYFNSCINAKKECILMMPEFTDKSLDEIINNYNGIISDNICFYEDYYNSIRK